MEALEIASKKIDLRDFKSFSQEEDVTVSEWLSTKGLYDTTLLRGVARFLTTAWVGREPEECGIHYVLDYIKSAGGLASINVDGPGGAQELKVREG
jgi:monoamine oxidase